VLDTNLGTLFADFVVFAAGPYSLLFAQELGYGLDLGILPVAGSFFSAGEFVKGKVCRPQVANRPFAELHMDPDVLNQQDSRLGPTTKPLPLMERHHYGTFFDFIKLPNVSLRGLFALFVILFTNKLVGYVLKNVIFDFPIIGKLLLLRDARLIIPTLRYDDLKARRGAGGIRPQIVNLTTMKLEMGDSSIVGDNIIFNTTPSPGASICLGNAERDARRVAEYLKVRFDEEAFERDLCLGH
jgi:malate dehydrogenase (quinone)